MYLSKKKKKRKTQTNPPPPPPKKKNRPHKFLHLMVPTFTPKLTLDSFQTQKELLDCLWTKTYTSHVVTPNGTHFHFHSQLTLDLFGPKMNFWIVFAKLVEILLYYKSPQIQGCQKDGEETIQTVKHT